VSDETYERLAAEQRPRRVQDHTRIWQKLPALGDASEQLQARVDAFCASKRISVEALTALGTRIAIRRGGGACLAYAGTNGNGVVTAIKYRPLGGSSHDSDSEKPSVWLRPIIVGKLDSLDWFIAEGETDTARLYDLVGDVAAIVCLPTGARADFRREWAALIPRGATVQLAHDADDDGDKAAAKAAQVIGGRTIRVRPPDGAKDWCEWDGDRAQFVALVQSLRAAEDDRFAGIAHADLLKLDVVAAAQLVDGLIEAATLGTIAGLPETYKSFLASEIALKVAAGGSVHGRKVLHTGSVGYWWQDDSRENEVRRVQAQARARGLGDELPIRWHLNEGLVLPRDIAVLHAEVESEQQVLVVLDSLYNFLLGIKLKDEDVATVLAQLKADVCDPTGCALLFVDHSPWPSESNQGQRRGYGSVFKAAAIRWGIYLDRSGDVLFVEGRGNNIAGLERTPALWDADRLELRLVEPPAQSDDIGDRIADFLRRNPGASTTVVKAGVSGTDALIQQRLESDERFRTAPAVLFGKPSYTHCWVLAEDLPSLLDATPAENAAGVPQGSPTDTTMTPAQPAPSTGGTRAAAGVSRHPCESDPQGSPDPSEDHPPDNAAREAAKEARDE
jgi:hypothetical protein